MAGFGPNEWLVDEIYQQYLDDPKTVDPALWDSCGLPAADGSIGTVRTGTKAKEAPAQPPRCHDAGPKPKPRRPRPEPRTAKRPALSERPVPSDADVVTLRGASARVVSNMETSLEVPTATSVRAVPAKLLIDNRTVINNHLRRKRGGKVSFTHVIGFALVQAVREQPEMNDSFAVIAGKPSLVKPEHVNLGLAVDTTKPDGTRNFWCRTHQGRRGRTSRSLVGVRGRRDASTKQLTADDFAGTTISFTNPGTIGQCTPCLG